MEPWIERRERTIAVPDRELHDVWFDRGDKKAGEPPRSSSVIASSGAAISDAVIELIRGAERTLAIGSFLIGSDAVVSEIERAWKRGVRTYVLSASQEQLKTTKRALTDEDQLQVGDHQALLDRLAMSALVRAAPGFHAKFVLADPMTGGPGLVLTANLRDGAMRSNDELAVRIEGDNAVVLATAIRWSFWEAATHQLTGPGRLAATSPLGMVPWTFTSDPPISTRWGDELTKAALELLTNPSGPILASSFTLSPSNEVTRRLCALAEGGVDVTVLINPMVRSAISVARAMSAGGCKVLGREHMHAKALSAGGSEGLVHTLNFDDTERPDSTLDVGVVLRGTAAGDLDAILRHWADSAPYEFAPRRQLQESGAFVILAAEKPVKSRVAKEYSVDLGRVVARSADEMHAAPEPLIPSDVLAHSVRASWVVEPPVLGQKAKLISAKPEPGQPGVYRDRGRVVVAIDSFEAMPAAQVLKRQRSAAAIVFKAANSIDVVEGLQR